MGSIWKIGADPYRWQSTPVFLTGFRRQLEYKAAMTGAKVVVVSRWFPSSKTCSVCGEIHDMPLSQRLMSCSCGNTMDRDLNAAINLRNYAVSSTVSVCGEESSGFGCKTKVKLSSVKQKSSLESTRVGLVKS